MLIEVIGTGSVNRGAELMLAAVSDQRQYALRGHRLCVPWGDISRATRSRLQLDRAPLNVLSSLRMVAGKIGAVFDASGFRYSDQWGSAPTVAAASQFSRWRERGRKIVMLPQAFGPFTGAPMIDAFRRIFEAADLVYARDLESYEHIKSLTGPHDKLRAAPDMTILLEPAPAIRPLPTAGRVVIVPNVRMTDKADAAVYFRFLEHSVRLLRERGVPPLFVFHATKGDSAVVEELRRRVGGHLETLDEIDPLALKALLGAARFVVASRYHAIVSSFSMSVPCAVAGWSHKYPGLVQDFNVPELLLERLDDLEAATAIYDSLLDPGQRDTCVARLSTAAGLLKTKVHAMWRDVAARL
jgi:polysaccharide pyruvyl transferase WcaK-like protein